MPAQLGRQTYWWEAKREFELTESQDGRETEEWEIMGILWQLSALSRQARGEESLIHVAATTNCDLGMDQCGQLSLLVAEIMPGFKASESRKAPGGAYQTTVTQGLPTQAGY